MSDNVILCSSLEAKLGGSILNKSADDLLQELSSIGHQVNQRQREQKRHNTEQKLKDQERKDKLVVCCREAEQNCQKEEKKAQELQCQVKKLRTQLCKTKANNRKNNRKLCDGKGKLRAAQTATKLMARLHNYDDQNLNDNIEEDTKKIEYQKEEMAELRAKIEETKQNIEKTIADNNAAKL